MRKAMTDFYWIIKKKHLEKLAKATRDLVPGGSATQDTDPKQFNKKELKDGTKHELEHTNKKPIAKEIAMDHLLEDPKYYTRLDKIEKKAALKERIKAYLRGLQ